MSIDGDGNLSYSPDPQFVGNDTFGLCYTDSDGMTSNTVDVNVSVTNSGPSIWTNGIDTTTADFSFYHDDVLISDGSYFQSVDVEGDPIQYVLADGVSHGTLGFNLSDGSFQYTPVAGFVGDDWFRVSASDALGVASPNDLTVYLHVTNDPPNFTVIDQTTYHIAENALPGAIVGSVEATDVNPGDYVEYKITAGDSDGMFEVGLDGILHVGSNLDQNFDRSITPEYNLTIKAKDQLGASSDLHVKVVINEAPAPPTIVVFINIDDEAGVPQPPPANPPNANNPFGLNQDDFNRLQNDRQASQRIVQEMNMDMRDANTRADFASIINYAEQRLAIAQNRVASLESMRANPSQFTKQQYYETIRDAVFNYDRYIAAYSEVQTVKANYLASFSTIGWFLGGPDQSLLARAGKLPAHIDGLEARMSADQFDAIAGTLSQINSTLARTQDDLAFTQGAMEGTFNACAVGFITIGAVAVAPGVLVGLGASQAFATGAVVAGGFGMLVGGTASNASVRLQDSQSLSTALVGGTFDTLGVTNLAIGIPGRDPATA